ncbi:MAG TPA: hypothetical protein DDZ11_01480 [Lentisphaeria bacterium]|nr:hypothetical protein [Lentisphaeria bacterium]
MKKILSLSLALCAASLLAWDVSMQDKLVRRSEKGGSIVDKNNKTVLCFSTTPAEDFSLLKVEVADGEMTIDTRDFFEKNNKGYVLFFWQGIKQSEFVYPEEGKTFSEKVNTARVIASPGTPALQFFGNHKKGQFYAKANTVTEEKDGMVCITNTDAKLPKDVTWCSLRQVFSKAGVFKIRSASLTAELPPKDKSHRKESDLQWACGTRRHVQPFRTF